MNRLSRRRVESARMQRVTFRVRKAFVIGAIGVGACTSPTEPCATPSRIAGNWSYSATQTSPVTANISGTIRFNGTACGQFTGALDATEVDAYGTTRRLVGDVSGRIVDSTTVQFDAYLGSSARQHIAALRGDSLKGDWLEVTASGASGSFAARRIVTP
jgi:hypothetical protein